jgi:hypothetical protein
MSTTFTSALLLVAAIVQPALAQPVTTIVNGGPSTNRIDLVVIGDGYTTADLPKYAADVQEFVISMFQQQPYSEYQAYFNVHRLDVISAESGADHPETQTYKNTALDATYNCAGIQRLICADHYKVLDVVTAVMLPSERDAILVLVNDDTYGGSGGFFAVSSTHPDGVEIVLHELGHSVGLLADEYAGGGASCDSSVEPAEPNATTSTARGTIKWNAWIDPSTEIPTDSYGVGVPGLYLGAKYCDSGLYRPTYDSKMRSLGVPFESINTEQLIKRYYNWASPIESSSPASGITTVTQGHAQHFSIITLEPASHTLERTWRVDGQPAGVGASIVLDSSLLSIGDHAIVVTAHDATRDVRSDPDGILTESVSWVLKVTPSVAISPCDVNRDGATTAADIQVVINEVLGVIPPTSDINRDGVVNIFDVMLYVNAALGRGCSG